MKKNFKFELTILTSLLSSNLIIFYYTTNDVAEFFMLTTNIICQESEKTQFYDVITTSGGVYTLKY